MSIFFPPEILGQPAPYEWQAVLGKNRTKKTDMLKSDEVMALLLYSYVTFLYVSFQYVN